MSERLYGTFTPSTGYLVVSVVGKPMLDNVVGRDIETVAEAEAFLHEHGIEAGDWKLDDRYGERGVLVAHHLERTTEGRKVKIQTGGNGLTTWGDRD